MEGRWHVSCDCIPRNKRETVGSLSNTKKPDEGGERDEENSPKNVSRAEVAEGPELGRIRAYPGSHRCRGDLGAEGPRQ